MALGARKAFQDLTDTASRDRWLGLPYIGCDGMPKTGQTWVKRGLLAATIIIPANADKALDMLVHALEAGTMPVERTMTVPLSFPALDALAAAHAEKARIMAI